MNLEKGKFVDVIDRRDNKPYQCKIVGIKDDLIKIHYHGWNAKWDEWLQKDSPRLVEGDGSELGVGQSSGDLSDSVESAEQLIDSMAQSLLTTGGTSCDSMVPLISRDSSVSVPVSGCVDGVLGTKRGKEPDSSDDGEIGSRNSRRRPSIQYDSGPSADIGCVPRLSGVPRSGSGSWSSQRATAPHTFHDVDDSSLVVAAAAGGSGDGPQPPEGSSATQSSAEPLEPTNVNGTSVGGNIPANGVAVLRAPGDDFPECRLCRRSIVGQRVCCVKCKHFFHADTLCLGIDESVLRVLLTVMDGAITYNCCYCRSDTSQLLRIIGNLVKEVVELRVSREGNSSGVSGREGGTSAVDLTCRDEVMGHVRELREREKRADSIILRGLQGSLETVADKFDRICQILGFGSVDLVGLVRVGSTNLYRGRILNAEIRRALLLKVHELRNSTEFSSVYVHRDLTYQQRQDLLARRRAGRMGDRADQEQQGAGSGRMEDISLGLGTGSNSQPLGTNGGRGLNFSVDGEVRVSRESTREFVGGNRGSNGGNFRGNRGNNFTAPRSVPRNNHTNREAAGREMTSRGRGLSRGRGRGRSESHGRAGGCSGSSYAHAVTGNGNSIGSTRQIRRNLN